MKGSSGKDLNLLSEQLGKDAVSRVHRLELENQRLLRELEAAKVKMEKEAHHEQESESRKINSTIAKLEEQVKRDNQALARSEQDVLETRRENENLQTVIETLKQQNRNLQIEKETEVEALSKQVTCRPCRPSSL